MSNLSQLAYIAGASHALSKLGTEAGPIAYSPRFTRERDELDEDKMVQLWAENDREPFVTGDESGIGMPSPGSAAKTAGLDDAGFSQFSSGIYGNGGADANRLKVDKDHRRQADIQNAFDSNEAYDQSYGPESAATQPHGSKYASLLSVLVDLRKTAASGIFGVGSSLKPSTAGFGKGLNPTANKIKPMNPQVDGVVNPSIGWQGASSAGSPAARQQGGTV